MLTFEKVLDVFNEYLAEDTTCEVILTSRGYTVMYWDDKLEEWYGVEYCKSPKDLQKILANSFHNLKEM